MRSETTNPHATVSKEEFCAFCHSLYARRLVSGSGGNVAVRSELTIFLTPTGFSLRDMTPHLVSVVDGREGVPISGPGPTKEAGIHLKILTARPDVQVVCHIHGAYIIAATTMLEPGQDPLPPLTPGMVHYIHPLPMLPFLAPGSEELAETVQNSLSNPDRNALLLQNHGLITVGKTFSETLNLAEEVDEAARIFIFTDGKARSINKIPGD